MSYLPQSPPGGGLLPYWLLLTSSAAIYNALQNYVISWQTKEVYGLKPDEVTPLAARLFAAWTFTSAVIRCWAAYTITDTVAYNLAVMTYIVANLHFWSELLFYKTVTINRASIPVFFAAIVSMTWIVSQRGYYLGL